VKNHVKYFWIKLPEERHCFRNPGAHVEAILKYLVHYVDSGLGESFLKRYEYSDELSIQIIHSCNISRNFSSPKRPNTSGAHSAFYSVGTVGSSSRLNLLVPPIGRIRICRSIVPLL
jgi:hypothetical protein